MEFRVRASLCILCATVVCVAATTFAAPPGPADPPMYHSTKPADGQVMKPKSSAPEQVAQAAPPAPAKPSGPATALTGADVTFLNARAWSDRVADDPALWVSIARQRIYLVQAGKVLWSAPCGTAAAGAGANAGSNQTPLGWHRIGEKIGAGAQWGQVFRSRKPSREIWAPGMDTREDLVLTRILWLSGLEEGINQGNNKKGVLVDSRRRYIYIHGTNGEGQIGQPSSHGCIRLLNTDVIDLFDRVSEGTLVLITE